MSGMGKMNAFTSRKGSVPYNGPTPRVKEEFVEKRLQEQARNLQQSINDSNVIGNEFNRQEAEQKIELDFLENDKLVIYS